MKLGDLFIKLGLKSQEFEQGINKAKGGMSGLMTVAKSVGEVLAAAFSVQAMVQFFTTSVKLANEQIAIETELEAALKANGKEVDINMRRYKRFASEMQSITTVGDETTLSLIRLAESMQSKAPTEAARMAIGLSKALKMDLNTATRASVLVQNENYIALSRYIPAVRTAKTEAEKMAAVQQVIASGMQIATDEINTASGKVDQLKNSWGDFQETIGVGISQSNLLNNSLIALNGTVSLLNASNLTFWQKLSGIFDLTGTKTAQLLGLNAALEKQAEFTDNVNARMAKHTAELDAQTKKQVEQVKTYNDLNEELKELLELKGNLSENDKAGITVINQEIEALKNKIKALDELGIAIEKVARAENRSVGAIAPGQQFSGQFTAREQYSGGFAGTMRDVAPIDTKQLADMTNFLQKNSELTKQYTDEMLADWHNFNNQLANLIQDFGTDVVAQFGEAMGELLATGEIDGDFGLRLLESIGRFVSTLGSMLIALGIGSESFKTLLGSGFLSGGIGAIAAGAVLVAAGGAISGYARSRAAGGSGGSGGGSGMFNQNYNIQQAQASGSQATLFLKGDNIYMSQQRNAFKRGVIG